MHDEVTPKPTPYRLWVQADRDPERYVALMKKHGHLVEKRTLGPIERSSRVSDGRATTSPMKKVICDGCGKEIKNHPESTPSRGDGVVVGYDAERDSELSKTVEIHVGDNWVRWQVCQGCLELAADALAKALPASRRSDWDAVIRDDSAKAAPHPSET